MHTQDTHTCMHAYSHTIPTIRVQCILIAVIVAVMLDKQMLGRPLSRCGDIWRRRHALRPRLENLQSNRIWGIAGTLCGIRPGLRYLFHISAKKKAHEVTWGLEPDPFIRNLLNVLTPGCHRGPADEFLVLYDHKLLKEFEGTFRLRSLRQKRVFPEFPHPSFSPPRALNTTEEKFFRRD